MGKPNIIFYIPIMEGRKVTGGIISITKIMRALVDFNPVLITNRSSSIDFRNYLPTSIPIEYVPFAYTHRLNSVRQPFSLIRKLVSLVKLNTIIARLSIKHRARLIHFNDIIALANGGIGGKFLAGTSNVLNIRGTLRDNTKPGIQWRLLAVTDKIVVLSNDMIKRLAEQLRIGRQSVTYRKMEVIYSILDPCATEQRTELKPLGVDFRHVLIVAGFNDLKNQYEYIEKCGPKLAKNGIVTHFVGDFDPTTNAYALKCELLCQQSGMSDYFVFHGFSKEVSKYYNSVSLTLVTSRREGMARCMIESLNCGTPVVSFDVSSASEILVQHDCGWVIPQGDYELFAQTILNHIDRQEVLEEKRKNGKQLTQRLFNEREVVSRYENLYRSLISS